MLIIFLSCLNVFGTLVYLLPSEHWLIEIIQNFGWLLLWSNLIGLILLAFYKSQKQLLKGILLLIQIIGLVLFAQVVKPFYFNNPEFDTAKNCAKTPAPLKVLYANVHSCKSNIEQLQQIIKQKNPDIVALLEANQTCLERFNLANDYSHSAQIAHPDFYDLALFSKYPLEDSATQTFGQDLKPQIIKNIKLDDAHELSLILIHAMPPLSDEAHKHNRVQLRRISTMLKHNRKNYLLFGDFNATPFSGNLQKNVNWANLKHIAYGLGYYNSWNALFPPGQFMIDHGYVKGCVTTKSFEKLPRIGSDHYPLFFELAIG